MVVDSNENKKQLQTLYKNNVKNCFFLTKTYQKPMVTTYANYLWLTKGS